MELETRLPQSVIWEMFIPNQHMIVGNEPKQNEASPPEVLLVQPQMQELEDAIDFSLFEETFDPFAEITIPLSAESDPLPLQTVVEHSTQITKPVQEKTLQTTAAVIGQFAQALVSFPSLFSHAGAFCAHCLVGAGQSMGSLGSIASAGATGGGHWHFLANGAQVWHNEQHGNKDTGSDHTSNMHHEHHHSSAPSRSQSWGAGPQWMPSLQPHNALSALEDLWLPQFTSVPLSELPTTFLQ